jgi:NRPS condensation-like uncharacterized protein
MAEVNKFKVTAQDAYNFAASKHFADQQLCMVLKLNGKIDSDAFAKAIRLSLDLEPVLGCRFIVDGGSPRWERRDDLDQIKLCSQVEVDTAEQPLNSSINQAINATVDPLVAAQIFREKDVDTLCVKVNHSACDAGGLKEYVGLLSDLYGMLITCGKRSIQPSLGSRDQSQLFERTKNPKTLSMKGFPTPTWTLPQKPGKEPMHAFVSVSKASFRRVKEFAKDRKATFNDALLAALFRTLFAINNTAPDKPMIIQVSIDLRRYLPNRRAEAICNLSGALYVSLTRVPDEPFEGTLARVAEAMNKLKQEYPGVESAAGLEYLFSQGFVWLEKYLAESAALGRKYGVTFPLLSNFGVLEKYCFGELQVTAGYVTSPVMYPPGYMLGASTFNDELTLSIGYCGEENTKQINAFLDAFVAELPLE